jgi:hypothetical protein
MQPGRPLATQFPEPFWLPDEIAVPPLENRGHSTKMRTPAWQTRSEVETGVETQSGLIPACR